MKTNLQQFLAVSGCKTSVWTFLTKNHSSKLEPDMISNIYSINGEYRNIIQGKECTLAVIFGDHS